MTRQERLLWAALVSAHPAARFWHWDQGCPSPDAKPSPSVDADSQLIIGIRIETSHMFGSWHYTNQP